MSILTSVSRALIGLAFASLTVAVLIQVIGRSTGFFAPVWTEELSRFSLLFIAAFGAGLAYRSGDLVNVDLICENLPGRWPTRLRLFGAMATFVLCLMLILPAWRFTSIGVMQTSPALSWRMDFIHASVLVLILSLCLFSGLRLAMMLLGHSDGRPKVFSEENS
ncbi:TRAP transporter small permease (plasmid) [Peteryoungia desertarenae]|uniref:TRAP transporter small permease protein n=1 Tax=Peteryoungia desertarenae TaxID=1813451 RepID=A0ABX6QSA7_9HYPH|nr:TRAP transporter small permease [Peteryoungia desertarenae]QLF71498.1 TRAP transporter small permease [Peteryoungia desertarenae]